MIVLDTHAWIWWVSESPKLSETARKAIINSESLGINVISCWEVAMLVAKKRIGFRIDVQDWIELALKRPKVQLISIDPKIAILSTRLPGDFHDDPADRFIAATCLKFGVPLISKDRRIAEWGYVETIW